ncbi:MAG: hypothetical protein FJ386_01735 [Verrucomicrobia bacterium]|nr:hypothetical protein [Verrucomicrobiota bacterium]
MFAKVRPQLLPVAAVFAILSMPATAADAVKLTEGEKSVRVELNGQLFTQYHFKDVPRPYCYPVIGPGGVHMTRHAPMKKVENEDPDHPHHRGLWYAHGAVNGSDFWAEGAKSGKTVHVKFLELKSGDKVATLRSANKWVTIEGKTVCTDERTMRFHADRTIDLDITYIASEGEVVLGDTKEGSCSIRLAETMRLKPNKFNAGKPTGQIVLSTGVTGAQTWGKRAAWCDYYGPNEGKTVGVAIFDHPSNPKHPTWWHVRDYGLFSANPFGVHDFESKRAEPNLGDIKIEAGKSLTWKYRYYFHEGDEKQGNVAARYADWTQSGK